MPYKRPGSPYYMVRRRNLPGFGDSGVLSSKTKSKSMATAMENLLDELAGKAMLEPQWRPLLEAAIRHRIDLPALLSAKSARRLEDLLVSLNDPQLTAVVEAFETFLFKGLDEHAKRTERQGLAMIRAYAPSGVRLSYFREAKNVTLLCKAAEDDGRLRNSVRRTMLRAISLLLRHELGNAERDRVFADVRFSGQDDTREVHLTPANIGALLRACDDFGYHELRTIIRVALLTSADRGVLVAGRTPNGAAKGMKVKQLQIYLDGHGNYSGEVYLDDTKARSRRRTVPLTDALCREIVVCVKGKAAEDQVFSTRYQDLDFPWQRVREKAGLASLRFKDLRAQVGIYGEEAGVPLTVLTHTYGHDDEAMTRRYQARQAAMSMAQASAIETAMFSGLRAAS